MSGKMERGFTLLRVECVSGILALRGDENSEFLQAPKQVRNLCVSE